MSDPAIDEVRAVRRRISAQFDHDPKKLVEHYMELQKRHRNRLIANSGHADTANEAAVNDALHEHPIRHPESQPVTPG